MQIGIGPILAIVFLVLKLTNVIDWSWVWIFAPVWIPLGLWALLMGTASLLSLVGYRLINRKAKK
ncbi:membrane protein [Mycobacterium phage SororFago]|nr:membrane protein [Mycobacterium phage SororFago]